MNNLDLSQLKIVNTLNAQLSEEPENFNLDDEGNGWINISLEDLKHQQDIEKVKPLYDYLGQDADRDFGSIKVQNFSIQNGVNPPGIWMINETQPALRVGGTIYNLLIEAGVKSNESPNPQCNVYITSYVGKGDTQTEIKHPVYYSVSEIKTTNGVMKVLSFTLYIPDTELSYSFKCLNSGENVDKEIAGFVQAICTNKPEKAYSCLSFLRNISYAKKVNFHDAFKAVFTTPGMFRKISDLYPKGIMTMITQSQRYYNDNQYGRKIDLKIDFAYYTTLWGFDPEVNAQGKKVKLSECMYLVIASNQFNSTLIDCFAENYQAPLMLKINAPNKKDPNYYPQYSVVQSSELSSLNTLYTQGMVDPKMLKAGTKEPKKLTSTAGKFSEKVKDFSFE